MQQHLQKLSDYYGQTSQLRSSALYRVCFRDMQLHILQGTLVLIQIYSPPGKAFWGSSKLMACNTSLNTATTQSYASTVALCTATITFHLPINILRCSSLCVDTPQGSVSMHAKQYFSKCTFRPWNFSLVGLEPILLFI